METGHIEQHPQLSVLPDKSLEHGHEVLIIHRGQLPDDVSDEYLPTVFLFVLDGNSRLLCFDSGSYRNIAFYLAFHVLANACRCTCLCSMSVVLSTPRKDHAGDRHASKGVERRQVVRARAHWIPLAGAAMSFPPSHQQGIGRDGSLSMKSSFGRSNARMKSRMTSIWLR
jgi:hypothetical protein